MKKFRKIAAIICLLLGCNSLQGMAQEFQPDLQRLGLMMLSEKATGDVDDIPYLNYLDSLGFEKSDTDIGKLRFGEFLYNKGFGKDTVQVDIRNMKNDDGKLSRSVKIKTTSDMMGCQMVEQLTSFGMEEVENNNIMLGLAGNGIYAGYGDKILIMRCEFPPSQSYMERPIVSDDGKARMDTIDKSLVCRMKLIIRCSLIP